MLGQVMKLYKTAISITLAGLLFPSMATAAPDLQTQQASKTAADLSGIIKPYQTVGNFKDEAKRIYMFVSFDCPYCASTWAGFAQWGRTLPEPYQLVFVPLFGTKTQNAAATAFYIVRDMAPNRINEYMRLAYGETTNRRVTPDTYVGILRSMGFSQAQINASLNSKNIQNRIARAIDLSRRYRVSVTPSFGVVGKYTTHAGFTNGDYSLLTQLLNGLVSDAMEKI